MINEESTVCPYVCSKCMKPCGFPVQYYTLSGELICEECWEREHIYRLCPHCGGRGWVKEG